MQPSQEPSGPTLWGMWGEMRQAFGRLEAMTLANRQAMRDGVEHVYRRQDDMRRELLGHVIRIERKMDREPSLLRRLTRRYGMAALQLALYAAGAAGLINPQWVRMLSQLIRG